MFDLILMMIMWEGEVRRVGWVWGLNVVSWRGKEGGGGGGEKG